MKTKDSKQIFLVGAVVHLGLLGATLGCSSRPDIPPTAEVSGTVTLDGQPVSGAQVQFIPDTSQGTVGPPALAYTDAAGRYELVTAGIDGALVGHHLVRVEARAAPKDETDTFPPLITPQRYSQESTSGLKAEVKAEEHNQIDLTLTTKPQ